jgi:hypothetical protein
MLSETMAETDEDMVSDMMREPPLQDCLDN